MTMPDGNTAALRRHEKDEDEADRYMDDARFEVRKAAEEAMSEPREIRELVYDHEIDPASCLARCFGNLDHAWKGEEIGTTAILSALSILRLQMQNKWEDEHIDEVYHELRGG